MSTRMQVFNRRSARATAILVLALATATGNAQASDPTTTDVDGASETARFETIRVSRPDGTVVTLRVRESRPLIRRGATQVRRSTGSPARYRSAEDQGDADTPDHAEGSGFTPRGFMVSHPTRGRFTMSPEGNLAELMIHSAAPARLGGGPVVAGDDPTEWRTGLGWVPKDEDGDDGRYIGSDAPAVVRLVSGGEFQSDTDTPPPQGDEEEPGYDAEAVARWDVVPHQTFAGDFVVGILAFHMNGIDRVEVSLEGGPWTDIGSMQINPRTGVREYVAEIAGDDVNLLDDEEIELRAIAYPAGAGTPRLLDPLYLFVNNQGTLTGPSIHVAVSGNDSSGNGSAESPYATIRQALNDCHGDIDQYEGARIVLTEPGRYDIDQPSQPVLNERWITVEAHEALARDDVVIAAGSIDDLVRPNTQRLRFQGVSIDFADMYQMYKEDPHQQWYDDCRWYYSEGWTYTPPASLSPVRNVGYGGLFVTDSLAEDMLYAFVNCNYVRGAHAEKISGDVFQNSLMVVQSSANNIDGTVANHHSDLFQYFGYFDNLLVYNVNASLVVSTQNFFLDHYNSTFSNCAFVNISVQNDFAEPPFSQLNSAHDHVLFYHISNPGQRFVMRDDMSGSGKFTAKNVIFSNNILERMQPADFFGPIPDGVSIDHCHFNYDQPRGEEATVGAIFILNSSGGVFDYAGVGAGQIIGSARVIQGYSDSDTPDRGASPWGTPR